MDLHYQALQDFFIWALSAKLDQLWPKLVGPGDPQGPWGLSRRLGKPPICPGLWLLGGGGTHG